MASPNLPTSITNNVTTGHSPDHETAHTLLNAFDTTITSGSEGEALVMGADGRYVPGLAGADYTDLVFTIVYNGTSFPARSTAPTGARVMWINTVNTDEPTDSATNDLLVKVAL